LFHRPDSIRPSLRVLLLMGLALAAGCDTNFPIITPPNARPAGRDFASAPLLELPAGGVVQLTGVVSPTIVDVWNIGTVSAGDRIVLTVNAALGSFVDPVAALFDNDEDLMVQNDDVDANTNRFDARIEHVVAESSARCFVAISASFFSSNTGAYIGELRVIRGGLPRAPQPQKLMLNFAAASNVNIPNVGRYDFPAFNAADIDLAYAGQTALIKAGIVARVRALYARYGVIVQTSDDGLPITAPDVSTIYFGNYSRTVFGISQQVDSGNRDACDDGIVFTDAFDDAFAVRPTTSGIALAIANVAAHEAGHLLGLAHVADVLDLMDTTGSASTLLGDQQFKRSQLDRSVFRIGFQNGPKLLEATVGLAAP